MFFFLKLINDCLLFIFLRRQSSQPTTIVFSSEKRDEEKKKRRFSLIKNSIDQNNKEILLISNDYFPKTISPSSTSSGRTLSTIRGVYAMNKSIDSSASKFSLVHLSNQWESISNCLLFFFNNLKSKWLDAIFQISLTFFDTLDADIKSKQHLDRWLLCWLTTNREMSRFWLLLIIPKYLFSCLIENWSKNSGNNGLVVSCFRALFKS